VIKGEIKAVRAGIAGALQKKAETDKVASLTINDKGKVTTVEVPADLQVIRATGLHVYPGMIDAATSWVSPSWGPPGRPVTMPKVAISSPTCGPASASIRFGAHSRDAGQRCYDRGDAADRRYDRRPKCFDRFGRLGSEGDGDRRSLALSLEFRRRLPHLVAIRR